MLLVANFTSSNFKFSLCILFTYNFIYFLSFFVRIYAIDGLRSASPNKIKVKLNRRSSSIATAVISKAPVVSTAAAEAEATTTTTSSTTKTPTTCCNCFGPLKKQWGDDDVISNQMSEVYCRTCDEDDHEVVHIPKNRFDSPAILTNVVTKRKIQKTQTAITATVIQPKNVHSIFNVESELEMPNTTTAIVANTDRKFHRENIENNKINSEDFELGDDAVVSSDELFDNSNLSAPKAISQNPIDDTKIETIRVYRGKEELPVHSSEVKAKLTEHKLCHSFNNRKTSLENSLDNIVQSNDKLDKCDDEDYSNTMNNSKKTSKLLLPGKVICTHDHPLILHDNKINANIENTEPSQQTQSQSQCKISVNNNDGSNSNQSMTMSRHSILKRMHRMYSTLPKIKKKDTTKCSPYSIPSRTTPDGTTIYYMCDLSKNLIKGSNGSI